MQNESAKKKKANKKEQEMKARKKNPNELRCFFNFRMKAVKVSAE